MDILGFENHQFIKIRFVISPVQFHPYSDCHLHHSPTITYIKKMTINSTIFFVCETETITILWKFIDFIFTRDDDYNVVWNCRLQAAHTLILLLLLFFSLNLTNIFIESIKLCFSSNWFINISLGVNSRSCYLKLKKISRENTRIGCHHNIIERSKSEVAISD